MRLCALCCSVFLATALVYTIPAWSQPIAPEVSDPLTIVDNGGFESGDAMPAWWARFPKQPEKWGSHRRDTSIAHSGQASGLLLSEETRPPGAGVQWNRYGIPVEGGSALIASFWTRTEGVSPAGVGCHFYDEFGGHLGFVSAQVKGDGSEWSYVSQLIQVPDGAKNMGYALYGSDNGKTWYDDVALLGTPSTTAKRGTPTTDGRLDDGCWTDENLISTFAVQTGEKLATSKPSAWLAYDDEHLYVAFRCPHPEGADLLYKATEHDGTTWLDDSVEVYLDPSHSHRSYYQICVNNRGVIRDSEGHDIAWESGATARVQRGPDAWTVEIAIPYENLRLGLDVGTVWGIDLVRNDRVLGETSIWSLQGFHNAARFGNVTLTPDLTKYYVPGMQASLDAQYERIASLREEMRAAAYTPQMVAAPEGLLRQAAGEIARLRAIRTSAQLPEGGWARVSADFAAIQDTVSSARSEAIGALFNSGDSDAAEGFRVAIAHSLQKVRRSGPVNEGMIAREVALTSARDESESFQLVVVPTRGDLAGVTVQAGPLSGPGADIPLIWHRVDYVETAPPKYKAEYVGWWPDPLLPSAPFDVKAKERQPVWVTANVPPDARPGLYAGEVRITHAGRSITVPVKLRVRSFAIPRPGTLSTAFGLYASALSHWWWDTKPYQENMPIEMYAQWCEFLGKYRLAPKNFGRDYVSHTKTPDGDYVVDLSNLDKTVRPLTPKYFAPYSHCVYRLPTRDSIGNSVLGTEAGEAAKIVKAYADEWERQGLPKEVYIYGYDEPRAEHYPFLREAYEAVKKAVPGYPIMQTIGDPSPEALAGAVDIWCPLTPALMSDFYQERVKAGDTLWAYTCCSPKPPYANFFIDQPATDHRVLFWQVRQAGATGFLYWCVCYWHGLPNAASGEPCFPDVPIHLKDLGTYSSYGDNGDGLLVYPGKDRAPLPSIRLETIRDGIEDYEYLKLLSDLVAEAKALPAAERPSDELLARARELTVVPQAISQSMTTYTKDPDLIFRQREAVGDMIEELSRSVGHAGHTH